MARQAMHNRRAGRGSTGGGASWISYSDMMAALLLIFVLILSYSLYQYFTMLETKTRELEDQRLILISQQEGVVRIVGRDDDRETLSRHLPDPLQDPVLVAVIQMGRRLIKEDDLRLLHDGPGDQHLLTLAAADIPVGFLRQMSDPHALQHRKAYGLILRLRAAEDPHLR